VVRAREVRVVAADALWLVRLDYAMGASCSFQACVVSLQSNTHPSVAAKHRRQPAHPSALDLAPRPEALDPRP
jgi:hypothetical protein